MAIDPILTNKKASTLNDKTVSFASGNSFGNTDFKTNNNSTDNNTSLPAKKSVKRKKTQPQRLADTTVLKCRTLQPFMAELERADKASIDDVVDALAEFYINNGLPDRQKDVFQGMYEMNVKRL